MHATSIRLENFKRFSNVEIDLSSNITLFLGPNSSGKSSLIKALLGLKQTSSSSNENETFAAQGEYVDLGVYRDFVLEHDINKKIKIGININRNKNNFENTSQIYIEFCFGYDFATEQSRLFEILIYDQNDRISPIISLIKKQTRDTFLLKLSDLYADKILKQFSPSIFDETEDKANLKKLTTIWQKGCSVSVSDRYQFTVDKSIKKVVDQNPKQKSGVIGYLTNYPVQILTDIVRSTLRTFDTDYFYLGPLRRSPSRSYSRTAHLLSVGSSGEHTPSVLANLNSRASKERSKERPQRIRLEQLNGWIESIFPGRSVDSKTFDELVKLEIVRGVGAREVISDVGFGFSQVLPILVQTAVMPANTTLLIEQPELHLHPSAQSKLAEVIADASNSGRRFIIETHSEHFVRGLQLAVSNKTAKKSNKYIKLKPEDLKFIYVPRFPDLPKEMTLDVWGEFTEPWPSGFFDEGYLAALKLIQNKIDVNEKLDPSLKIVKETLLK